jgi:hypothetical protein
MPHRSEAALFAGFADERLGRTADGPLDPCIGPRMFL